MKRRRDLTILVVVAAILAASVVLAGSVARGATGGGTALGTTPWPSPSPSVVLQVGHNGAFVKEYTLADLQALPASSPGAAVFNGWTGFMNSGNIVYGPDAVSGIALSDVLEDVLGAPLGANQSVEFIGSDDYVQTYSDAQLTNVDQMTQLYDATTKKPVSSTSYTGPFAPILLYSDPAGHVFDPSPPPAGDGPLRLAVADGNATSENVVMTGSDSVKYLVKLNVVDSVAKDWSLKLTGLKINGVRQTRTIRRNDYSSCVNCHEFSHNGAYTTLAHKWRGVPLYMLVGEVDGGNTMTFNAVRATKGYRVEVISSTGLKRIVSSRLIVYQGDGRRNVVLAWTRDGLTLGSSTFPLRLVGPRLKASQEIGRVTRVVLLPLK